MKTFIPALLLLLVIAVPQAMACGGDGEYQQYQPLYTLPGIALVLSPFVIFAMVLQSFGFFRFPRRG